MKEFFSSEKYMYVKTYMLIDLALLSFFLLVSHDLVTGLFGGMVASAAINTLFFIFLACNGDYNSVSEFRELVSGNTKTVIVVLIVILGLLIVLYGLTNPGANNFPNAVPCVFGCF